jgi:hypothetical protein
MSRRATSVVSVNNDDDLKKLVALALALMARLARLEREVEKLRNAKLAEELAPTGFGKLKF